MEKMENNLAHYATNMLEIKIRLEAIRTLLSGTVINLNALIALESAALQLRKILELIIFSSLIANKEEYQKAYSSYTDYRTIRGIMKDLKK